MSKKSAKKPAVKRTRQLKNQPGRFVLIGAAAAVVLAAALIIAAILIITNGRKDSQKTPETAAPVQAKKVTLQTELPQTEPDESVTEKISESPQTEAKTGALSEEDAGYMEEARKLVSQMTREQKVACLFITTPEALVNDGLGQTKSYVSQAGEYTQNAYNLYPVSGFSIQDLARDEQPSTNTTILKTLNDGLQALSADPPILICIDEDYLKKLGQQAGGQDSPDGRFTIGGEALKMWGFNTVFSDISSENGGNNIKSSIQITADTADDLSVLNASGGFLSGYESIGQNGSGSYGSTAATGMAYYRQERNNCVLVVFEDGFYTAADTADELRKIRDEIRGQITSGFEPVILSRISDADVSSAAAAADSTGNPEMLSGTDPNSTGNQDGSLADGSEALTPAVRSLLIGADLLLCKDKFTDSFQSVIAALDSGVLTEQEIDDCAARVLAMRKKCFDPDVVSSNAGAQNGSGTDAQQMNGSTGISASGSDSSQNGSGTDAQQMNDGSGTPASGSDSSQNGSGTDAQQMNDGSGGMQMDAGGQTSGSDSSQNGSGTDAQQMNDGSGSMQMDAGGQTSSGDSSQNGPGADTQQMNDGSGSMQMDAGGQTSGGDSSQNGSDGDSPADNTPIVSSVQEINIG